MGGLVLVDEFDAVEEEVEVGLAGGGVEVVA